MSQKSQAVPSHRAFETLHIIFLIKSLTIPYVRRKKKEGTSREDRTYVSVKKKRGKGRESRKKKGVSEELGGCVCEKDKDKGEDKETQEDRGPH